MNAPDISPLVKGVLVVVMLAIGLGQYPKLEHWARSQAVEAMLWKQGLPYFFAAPHVHNKKDAHKPHSDGHA